MEANEAALSHEEIWDDSLLVDSWNQALAEYKKYHSIYLNGGPIPEIKQLNQNQSKSVEPGKTRDETQPNDEDESLDVEPGPEGNDELKLKDEVSSPTQQPEPQPSAIPAAFPSQAILGSVSDENMKKLMMSWYYAGYYTGLLEGQQQAQQQQQKEQKQKQKQQP